MHYNISNKRGVSLNWIAARSNTARSSTARSTTRGLLEAVKSLLEALQEALLEGLLEARIYGKMLRAAAIICSC